MDLEYVASGCAYFRLITGEFVNSPEQIDNFNNMIKDVSSRNDHTISVLYNAHTESSFGDKLKRNHTGSIRGLYSDSGGLQILTQGLTINSDMKNKIYKNQGKYSDFGMSFDEIPVKFSGSSSSRNAVSGRWFDLEGFEHKARETGRNLNDQINVFKEMGSDCKPMFIAQGNCLDTYKRWTEYALSELDPGNEHLIGGVAMGAAALGPGALEDIKRAYYYTRLPGLEHLNHLHLLGVGSAKRLVPVLSMIKHGQYKPGLRLSYDSTTHTSAPHLGSYYINDKLTPYNRNTNDKFYRVMYDDIKKTCGDGLYLDFEKFKLAINTGVGAYKELGGDPLDVVNAFQTHIISSIDNFATQVYRIANDEEELVGIMKGKERVAIRALKFIRDEQDFANWEREFSRFVKSKSYSSEKPNTLEALF